MPSYSNALPPLSVGFGDNAVVIAPTDTLSATFKSAQVALQHGYTGTQQRLSVEIVFTGNPGTFQVNLQTADSDADANYAVEGANISSVSAGNDPTQQQQGPGWRTPRASQEISPDRQAPSPGFPQKSLANRKIPFDSASYKIYYVNYWMGQNPPPISPQQTTGPSDLVPFWNPLPLSTSPLPPFCCRALFDDSHAHTKPPTQGTCGNIFSRGNENHVEESYVIGLLGTR
ncbi:MAG TPA: hypothetical protein VEJ47_09440 [Candidatus Eremiobacteraceae bacterium]|nr:hypothetical protein [Candidatus Eremiobacteraceae bacterium]